MITFNPQSVSFLGSPLTDVDAIAVDRRSSKQTEERTDLGPHIVFADVPEQRVTVFITRSLTRDEPTSFTPGAQGQLRFTTAPSGSDAQRRTYTATAVVLSIDYDLSRKAGARQRIALLALSTDGAADPINETIASPT
jgi:hypothetical protein